MTGVRQEAAAIGEHANKAAQQTQLGELSHLALHTVFLIVEPPARTELHFPRHAFALEVTNHGADDFVIAWIQAIDNGFG